MTVTLCIDCGGGAVTDVLLQEADEVVAVSTVVVATVPVADVGCAEVAVWFWLPCCKITVECLLLRCLLIFDVLPP